MQMKPFVDLLRSVGRLSELDDKLFELVLGVIVYLSIHEADYK